MSLGKVVSTIFGTVDAVGHFGDGTLSDLNSVTQFAMDAATYTNLESQGGAALTLGLSAAAISLGGATLVDDVVNHNSIPSTIADTLQLLGDVGVLVGSVAASTRSPEGLILAAVLDTGGVAINLLGLTIRNYKVLVTDIPIIYNELIVETDEEISKIRSA